MATPPADITVLLARIRAGDRQAEAKLIPLVYKELRRLAGSYMRTERSDHTLQPTALVHEAYLRMMGGDEVVWENRAHFFSVAAQLMRQLLVDHARAHLTQKRGGGAPKLQVNEQFVFSWEQSADLVALNEALERLAKMDPRQSKIVELRFFAGLTVEQTARLMGISEKTVKRDWQLARAWLYGEISRPAVRT